MKSQSAPTRATELLFGKLKQTIKQSSKQTNNEGKRMTSVRCPYLNDIGLVQGLKTRQGSFL